MTVQSDPPGADLIVSTQCFPPRLGGIETMMAALSRAFALEGLRVEVAADGADAPLDLPRGVTVSRHRGFKPLRRWRKARAVASALRAAPGAILLTDSWKSLEPLAASALRGHVALCLVHGMEMPLDAQGRRGRRVAAALAKADRVIANSAATAALTKPFTPADRIRVVNPGVAPQPTPDPQALARWRDLGAPLVACLCRLEPRKGVDMTLRAVAALTDAAGGGPVCVVAGDGPDRPRLEALARELGLGARAEFAGRVSEAEKAALMAAADVFAMPVRREGASVEGFGIVYLEAAWHGTPALAGREGGAADAVIDGRTGLLCDGADAGAVTDALRRLLDAGPERRAMADAARAHARAATWECAAREIVAIARHASKFPS